VVTHFCGDRNEPKAPRLGAPKLLHWLQLLKSLISLKPQEAKALIGWPGTPGSSNVRCVVLL
jgi:hypothetical protein